MPATKNYLNLTMLKKINASIFLLLITLFLFSSCDKDNYNKKLGQYAVGVKYNGNKTISLRFFINGVESGLLELVSTNRPSPVNDCRDLKKPSELVNVFVVKGVPVGKHKLEIKTETGLLLETLEFNMLDKECVFQQIEIQSNKIKSQPRDIKLAF